ncbi:MAG TPA: YihY/virulence factor BrkB family protein [Cyclobacteriaceae bacterium]|nr:YihY/virulence factor BrkB family protein [Cyclobacteriaceae bacterium]
MKNSLRSLINITKQSFKAWWAREPFNNSIVVAYYTIFSLPGLLVIVINVAGYFFGKEMVTDEISLQVGGLLGTETVQDVEGIAQRAGESKETTVSTILSVATLLFGATGVFYQVQQIFNKIWEVEPKPKQRIMRLIRDRLFSFGLILVVGFLLLVSLVLSAALSAMSDWVGTNVSEGLTFLFGVADFIVSLGVVTLLFASMFKFLPDAKIKWKDVWVGAFLTAILFTIAKIALGLYFGKSDPTSAYGAAGSVVLIMLWVSYAGLILFFGAEFTKIYSERHGRKVEPAPHAERVSGK